MIKKLDTISLTRKLVNFNTMNPPEEEHDCAKYLGQLLDEIDFDVKYYEFKDRRTTLVARLKRGGDNPPICFTGHLDVVPLGAAPWSRDPFKGETDGDKIYGRGTSDMKAGIAAMIIMAREISLKSLPVNLTLVFTAGEETCCEGAAFVSGLGKNAIGEAGAVVVGEPTSNYPIIGHKGCVRFNITTKGVTAHGSMPELGVNAIHKAADVINKLQEFDFNVSPHPLLGKPTLNIGTISGGININSVPDKATIGVEIRTIPGQSHEDIQRLIREILEDDVDVHLLERAISIETDPDDKWIQDVYDTMEKYLKKRPEPSMVTYFTDAAFLTPAFGNPPTVLLGPGEAKMAHVTDEFCHISRIEEAKEAYIEIVKKWCD